MRPRFGHCGALRALTTNNGIETTLCAYDDSGQVVWGRYCSDISIQCSDPDALNCRSSTGTPSPLPSCDFPQECSAPDGGPSGDAG